MERTDAPAFDSLQLILTSRCNLSCSYCYQKNRRAGTIAWDVLRPALDLVVESGHRRPIVSFQGGEPLLESDLVCNAIDYLEENCPETTRPDYYLVTNGTLLNDEIVELFHRHHVRIGLSFDGVRDAQDMRHPGTFDGPSRLLKDLRVKHPTYFEKFLTVSLTVWSGNLAYLAESVAFLHELGVASIALNPLITPDAGWRPEMIGELEAQFERVFQCSCRHLESTGKVPVNVLRRGRGERHSGDVTDSRCAAACGRRMAVDIDGRVYPCVVLAGSFQSLPEGVLSDCVRSLGDFRVTDFVDRTMLIDYAERVCGLPMFDANSGRSSSYGACCDCRFAESCRVCPVSMGHLPDGGRKRLVPDHQCAMNLVTLESREKMPVQPDGIDFLRALIRGV